MSSAFPTLQCYYSADGKSWSGDLGPGGAGDCSEITMNLRELVNGTGLTEIILNNYKGKYMAGVFAPWPQETGLGYWWKWTINGVGPWYGRAVDLSPELTTKREVLHVSVAMMDDPLKNYYLTNFINQDQIGNMIPYACQEWGLPTGGTYGTGNQFVMGGVTYSVDTSTSGKGPVYGSSPPYTGAIGGYTGTVVNYDCSRSRIYAIDYIKDLLVNAFDINNLYYGWSGYVDSTQGPFNTTLYIFPQGAKTYSSSITYGSNVSTISNSRNIMRSKNYVEFAGALANSEPPLPTDAWTEFDTSFWQKSTQGNVSTSPTHFCPVSGIEMNGPCYSGLSNNVAGEILIDQASILATGTPNISIDLDLQAALGGAFDCFKRNATSLNFYYKIPYVGLLSNFTNSVQLKDANGMVIQSFQPMASAPASMGYPVYGTVWPSWSAPVGPSTQYAIGLGTGSSIGFSINIYWKVVSQSFSSVGNFDWSHVTDIIINVAPPPLTSPPGGMKLYLDHLYFTQSYQAVVPAIDNDALASYSQRMQYYDASMYTSTKALQAFANSRISTLSPPAMQIDVTTSLTPDAEPSGKGFQPGYVFPAGNVNVSNYGYNLVAWRAVEVETHIRVGKDGGCTTRFILVPASTSGIGVDMAKFDPRRSW